MYIVVKYQQSLVEVADELHKLSGVELAVVDQVTAVAQDHADHRLHEQGDQNVEQGGDAGVFTRLGLQKIFLRCGNGLV